MFKRINRTKKGAALIEYALLIAGVALMAAAAVSVFGNKTSDMIAAVTSILPGSNADDNGAIVSGQLINTTRNAADEIIIDTQIAPNTIGDNTGIAPGDEFGGLVIDAE
ncbi:MAG: hypothetical protein WD226_07025 [Planctomycetota bacterium]